MKDMDIIKIGNVVINHKLNMKQAKLAEEKCRIQIEKIKNSEWFKKEMEIRKSFGIDENETY
jgi:hypothetical protein